MAELFGLVNYELIYPGGYTGNHTGNHIGIRIVGHVIVIIVSVASENGGAKPRFSAIFTGETTILKPSKCWATDFCGPFLTTSFADVTGFLSRTPEPPSWIRFWFGIQLTAFVLVLLGFVGASDVIFLV